MTDTMELKGKKGLKRGKERDVRERIYIWREKERETC